MCGEGFYAEGFGGVMAAEQKVNPKLFGGDSGPMRRFARNEGVDLFSSNAVNLRTSAAGNDADRMRLLRAEVERLHGAGQRSAQFADELFSWQRSARFQANKLSLKNGAVDLNPIAVASCALLPTFGWMSRGRCAL